MPFKDPEKKRERQKVYLRKWYASHREEQIKRTADYRRRTALFIKEYKAVRACVHCGATGPAPLHFHHLDKTTKSFGIQDGRDHSMSREKVLMEMAKCILLCASCHAKEHHRLRRLAASARS